MLHNNDVLEDIIRRAVIEEQNDFITFISKEKDNFLCNGEIKYL